ncbi:hypothetical protein ACQY0O_005236 [Thecaphora frezii]
MQPRRILPSAANASRHLAQRTSAHPASLAHPGPSHFPGCLESVACEASAAISGTAATLSSRARHLDFLYPSLSPRQAILNGTRPASRAKFHNSVGSARSYSAVPFYHASFPPRQTSGLSAVSNHPHPHHHHHHHQQQDHKQKQDGQPATAIDEPDRFRRCRAPAAGPIGETASGSGDGAVAEPRVIRNIEQVQAALRTGELIEAVRLYSAYLRYGWRNSIAKRSGKGKEKQTQPEAEAATAPAEADGSEVANDSLSRDASIIATAEQLMDQLTMRRVDSNARPVRGFSSREQQQAALHLWSDVRHFRIPQTTTCQTALIKALLRSQSFSKAADVFAAEVRTWWACVDAMEKRRPQSSPSPLTTGAPSPEPPSAAVFREIQRSLARFEESLLQRSHDATPEAQSAREEFCQALLVLCKLLASLQLPAIPNTGRVEVAWIVSAACRLDDTLGLRAARGTISSAPGAATSSSADQTAHVTALNIMSRRTRDCMRGFIRRLSDKSDVEASRKAASGGQNAPARQLPALQLPSYNRLIYYSLEVLRSPELCKVVFEHLLAVRRQNLEPDHVTFNIILRQATNKRFEALARAVLQASLRMKGTSAARADQRVLPVDAARARPSKAPATDVRRQGSAPLRSRKETDAATPGRLMLAGIDDAIRRADSYRLVALVQYVTSSGLFLRRHQSAPGHINVKDLVMRIYPRLDRTRRSPKPEVPVRWTDEAQEAAWQPDATTLRPRISKSSRMAIYDPHVLTATLNLVAKAGKTGLALRLWRLIKHVSRQSFVKKGEVSLEPWPIPVEAATILFQLLASEGRKSMKTFLARGNLSSGRNRYRYVGRFASGSRARRAYTRGWNLGPEIVPLRRPGGAAARWQAARLFAKAEYRQLLDRWNLAHFLESADTQPQATAASTTEHASRLAVHPDERFYDALLDLFGRRSGMRGRSAKYRSRSESLHRAEKARFEIARKRAWFEVSEIDLSQGGGGGGVGGNEEAKGVANGTLEEVTVVPRWNSQGRWTRAAPDPFLLLVLRHMLALDIPVPLAFRWLLEHIDASLIERPRYQELGDGDLVYPMPELQTEAGPTRPVEAEDGAEATPAVEADDGVDATPIIEDVEEAADLAPRVGRFSRFRNPRIKSIGKIVQLGRADERAAKRPKPREKNSEDRKDVGDDGRRGAVKQ